MKQSDAPNTSRDGWSVSQEREFVENLLNSRFNFFLVVFAAVVGGALTASKAWHMPVVLVVGAVVCWLLTATLWRSQHKLDILLAMISEDETHPVSRTNERAKGRSARRIIGYFLPTLCSLILTIALILAIGQSVWGIPGRQ